MAVTNYYTIDGQMLGYKDAGGRKDFLTDVLGSVTGEVDQTGTNRTFNGRYKPYGGMLWATGSRGSFGWVGTWGYKSTGLRNSSHYVRARHYSQTSGMWTTQDPLWPDESPYAYTFQPIVAVDATGTKPNKTGAGLVKCKKMKNPRDCFTCTEQWYTSTNAHYSPRKACDQANRWCGTNVKCGPLGINDVGKFEGCTHISSYTGKIHKHSDKMAHCVAICLWQRCFGLGFFSPIRWVLPSWLGGENSQLDRAAEEYGLECASKNSDCLMRPSCIDCCSTATYDIPDGIDEWE